MVVCRGLDIGEQVSTLPVRLFVAKGLVAWQWRERLEAASRKENPWAIRNPLDEARDLHRMANHGSCTVESIRDLISVPPEIEAALLAYADRYPKDGQRIHCVLQFRRRVAEEFERLVQGDMSFDPLPVEANIGELELSLDAGR